MSPSLGTCDASPFAAEIVALAGVTIKSGFVVVGGSAGPIDSFYLLMNPGLLQHSVVKAHCYQPVMYFGMAW